MLLPLTIVYFAVAVAQKLLQVRSKL